MYLTANRSQYLKGQESLWTRSLQKLKLIIISGSLVVF